MVLQGMRYTKREEERVAVWFVLYAWQGYEYLFEQFVYVTKSCIAGRAVSV